jgi:hypothetical protein
MVPHENEEVQWMWNMQDGVGKVQGHVVILSGVELSSCFFFQFYFYVS